MKNLFSLLERFSKSLNKDTAAKESVVQTVFARTKVLLKTEDVALKDGVLQIKAGASAKSEINLKEEGIRAELKEVHNISVTRILYI